MDATLEGIARGGLLGRREPGVSVGQDVFVPEDIKRGEFGAVPHQLSVGLDGRLVDALPGLHVGVEQDVGEQ